MDNFYLQKLVPVNPFFWYPMNEPHPNGDGAGIVFDRSGAMLNLAQASHAPIYQAITEKGITRNNVFFDGAANSLFRDFGASPKTVKHLFTLAKHNGNNFGSNYPGIVSGLDSTNFGILVGNASSNRFFNFGYGASYKYRKSQIEYPEANQLAPFLKPELLEVSSTSGWVLDGLQIGQDRENENGKWTGTWSDTFAFGRVLTENERLAANLYYDLKFGLWRKNGTILNFPSPNITNIPYVFFDAEPEDSKKVINSHEYDDGGKSFNRSSDYAPREWQIEFDCAGYSHAESKGKSDIFDAFYSQVWFDRTFSFTDKYGETHSKVRIADYNRSHSGHKSWSQNAKFKLVKLP